MISKTRYLFPFMFLALVFSCDNAELPPSETPEFCNTMETPFYNTNVKQIIDESCAYAGCHSNGGIGPGNYDTYNGILGILENGSFKGRVLEQKDNPVSGMPPDQSVYPESLKDDLTDSELEIIECWLDAGFPEG